MSDAAIGHALAEAHAAGWELSVRECGAFACGGPTGGRTARAQRAGERWCASARATWRGCSRATCARGSAARARGCARHGKSGRRSSSSTRDRATAGGADRVVLAGERRMSGGQSGGSSGGRSGRERTHQRSYRRAWIERRTGASYEGVRAIVRRAGRSLRDVSDGEIERIVRAKREERSERRARVDRVARAVGRSRRWVSEAARRLGIELSEAAIGLLGEERDRVERVRRERIRRRRPRCGDSAARSRSRGSQSTGAASV
jgi:hypothetical protein